MFMYFYWFFWISFTISNIKGFTISNIKGDIKKIKQDGERHSNIKEDIKEIKQDEERQKKLCNNESIQIYIGEPYDKYFNKFHA